MINNNKILTVSYGTFSCTLEGFDDSFGTMKAIAEYFRDLASDDRYFGAEPPQPDAEMLTRIAQKEISRRVEARERDGKIVLSAMEDQQVSEPVRALDTTTAAPEEAPAAAEVAPEAAPVEKAAAQVQEVTKEVKETVAETKDVVATQVEETTADLAEATTAPEAVVEATQEVAVSEPVIETDFADDEDVASIVAKISEDITDAEEIDIVPGQPDSDVEAFFAASTSTAQEDDLAEDSDFVAENNEVETKTAAAESIAAKLQRIRAVVAQQNVPSAQDDYSEDEIEEVTEASDVVAQARRDIEDALDMDEAADTHAVAEPDETEQEADDEISGILARLDREEKSENAAAPKVQNAPVADLEEDVDSHIADVANLFEDDHEEALKEQAKTAQDTPVAAPAKVAKVTATEGLTIEKSATDGPRARVIKVKRADLNAAVDRGDIEEYTAEKPAVTLDALAPAKTLETTLSAEDEHDLALELAALAADMELDRTQAEQEIHDQAEEAEIQIEVEVEVEAEVHEEVEVEAELEPEPVVTPRKVVLVPAKQGRNRLPVMEAEEGESMDRLLAEADNQMDEPESATRRDAFSHLRAAVAAKKADEALGTAHDDEEDDNAYRNDLADAVRPRRPAVTSQRAGDSRPAPLKLVAEQRVDVESSESGPVRPRRIAATQEEPVVNPEGKTFAEFATEMGATKLPQLLEAAAAYMSFVEDRDQFSRPQLMNKVRQLDPDGFSREDGLRSFGQLLRTGKIEKIKAGRFTVSDDIGFRPAHRAVG